MRKKFDDSQPMPLKDLFQLKEGDSVAIYYAKDDNPNSERLNGIYKIQSHLGFAIICPS